MKQTAHHLETTQALKGKLSAVYGYLTAHDDPENAEKVKQLAQKLASKEYTIAFCGHFSAGKSTMINRLVRENLLPSSPIPTSANLVKVKAGEEYVKVFFKNEKPRLYLAPYDYAMVKNYCKDGDQIREIEISHANSPLPKHTVIMDTPGIDSADDAHRIATESALHLADLILYVMDYNHVQSELNFMFTKELAQAGKEVYLVINQVDKHSERELSFAAFQASVIDAFASWGVEPADIFYTSLKNHDHAHNQFIELQRFVAERLEQRDDLLLQSIFHSLQKITNDHTAFLKKKAEPTLRPAHEILQELSSKERATLTDDDAKLREAQDALRAGGEKAEKEFDAGVDQILANAHLAPFQTRALAEAYLAACSPQFKVGLLFTRQKTLAARQERLQRLYLDILEKTKSQAEWHLRDFLTGFIKEKRIDTKELLAKTQRFSVHFSSELLTDAVKDGANLSGEYVLNYTNDVANRIGRIAKGSAAALKEELLGALQEKNTALQAKLTQKIAGLERYRDALAQIEKAASAEHLAQAKLAALLAQTKDFTADSAHLFETETEDCEVIRGDLNAAAPSRPKPHLPPRKPIAKEHPAPAAQSPDRIKDTAEKLKKAARLVRPLPGFRKIADELAEKAARLAHKGFTVALFGAFSAGKSSFANAFLGESVLPVSPNPTTAAINKIKPIDATHPHGAVIIKIKAEQAMLDDVNHALKLFGVHVQNLADAITQAAKLDGQSGRQKAAEKTGYAFLQAFTRGYAEFRDQLGTAREVTLSAFGDYAAQEERSCFVEWIDLYYDCPLTRKGITLVDTPGADSINARHTGVAFDFIKNSDAILFVTYYNHAFSKADREFLIQLGRVKDAFQLDKMFFIINAIDLAEDEEEKDTVSLYVREQLIQYGVKNPHLYPVSSLRALKEKQQEQPLLISGMADFESSFYHFITHDLANIAVAASESELQRVARLVENLIVSSREDDAMKRQKRAHIEAEKTGIRALLAQQTAQNLQGGLQQETNELLYYIKQRVFFRFNDFFKEAFHPSVLREDGRDMKKALQSALDEFLAQIGFDFAQEMRATTIRLDRFAEKTMTAYQLALVEKLRELNPTVSFSLFEFAEKAQIEFAPAFQEIDLALFAKAMTYFKNAKSFFEKNENKYMRDAMHTVLHPAADAYLQSEQNRVQALYAAIIEAAFGKLIAQMAEEADDFYLSLLSALDGGVPIEQLLETKRCLKEHP